MIEIKFGWDYSDPPVYHAQVQDLNSPVNSIYFDTNCKEETPFKGTIFFLDYAFDAKIQGCWYVDEIHTFTTKRFLRKAIIRYRVYLRKATLPVPPEPKKEDDDSWAPLP